MTALNDTFSTLPVFDQHGERPGKTLLITGGMDGDEYTGIEAAKILISTFENQLFAGRLIILPLVNQEGFRAGISQNPLDGKFPKCIFPGRAHGSPSERLVHWLKTSFIDHADVWLDLHSGATDEELHPFLETYRTGNKSIDAFIQHIHQTLEADTIVYEKAGFFSKAKQLARKERAYILAESGARGERNPEDIARHVHWAKQVMHVLGMIEEEPRHQSTPPQIYAEVEYLYASDTGHWQPEPFTATIHRGQPIGQIINPKKKSVIQAPVTGTMLWSKVSQEIRRGDFLCAIGHHG